MTSQTPATPSDTPLTDETHDVNRLKGMVPVNFARALERELAAAQDVAMTLQRNLGTAEKTNAMLADNWTNTERLLAAAQGQIAEYEFASQEDEFDEQGIRCMDLSPHYEHALSELTRRKAYSKHSCAQMIAEQAKRADKAEAEVARERERAAALAKALKGMIDMYVAGVNSGDWGNWNPETDAEVITARAALADGGPKERT